MLSDIKTVRFHLFVAGNVVKSTRIHYSLVWRWKWPRGVKGRLFGTTTVAQYDGSKLLPEIRSPPHTYPTPRHPVHYVRRVSFYAHSLRPNRRQSVCEVYRYPWRLHSAQGGKGTKKSHQREFVNCTKNRAEGGERDEDRVFNNRLLLLRRRYYRRAAAAAELPSSNRPV